MKKTMIIFLVFFTLSAFGGEKLPIVFVHGLGVNSFPYEHIFPMKRFFKKNGWTIHIARTPIAKSLEQRAEVLAQEIKRLVPTGQYHLLGHSMGGLDARLAIQKYQLDDRCVSLTTLASPHRGSAAADYVINNFGDTLAMEILEKLFGGEIIAVRQLTTNHMTQVFNNEVKNKDRVRYFSMQFYIPRPIKKYSVMAWLWVTHWILENAGSYDNDGLVSVESAMWGESLGVFAGDHMSETGPVPLGGKMMYQDVFGRVMHNLEEQF